MNKINKYTTILKGISMKKDSFYNIGLAILLVMICNFGFSQEAEDIPQPEFSELSTQAVIGNCSGIRCTKVLVDRLYINTRGRLYIGTSGVETSLSCTPTGRVYLYVNEDDKNYEEIFTTLLAAQLSDKKVLIRTPSSGACQVAYVVLDRQ